MSGLRSTSMTSVGAGIAIKFELQRTKEVELRRLRGDFTYDELLTAVNHMWGTNAPKNLSIEYVDDEGDHVKVGSEAEWAETVALHLSTNRPALRLYVKRGRKAVARKTEEVEVASSSSDEDVSEVKPSSARAGPRVGVPPLKLPDTSAREAAVVAPAPQVPVATAQHVETIPEVETGDESQAAVVDLLSRLYDCDAGREMMNMFSTVDFAPIVRRRLDAVAGEVLVDIDNIALRHLTISRTNMWIGQRLYEKAESTLEAALVVWPADQVLEYNSACAAALRGDVVKALAKLESAASHGYSDVAQLESDPDLASIRTTTRFKSIIAMVRAAQSTPGAEVATATTTEATPMPAAVTAPQEQAKPTAVPAEKWDPVATLMAMFPQLSADAAARLLKRHNGDLARAASSVLGN